MFLYLISICLFGLLFELFQAAPGDVESIELSGSKYAESGSDVEIVCTIANFSSNILISVYKTENSDISQALALNLCAINQCLDSVIGRYTFRADATSVRVLIIKLSRAEDQKYWTCASSIGRKILFLSVFTTPKSVYLGSLRNQTSFDLSFENVSLECFSTCVYPAPTFEWYSLEPGKLSMPVNTSAVTAFSDGNCGDAGSKTYRSTMYLREYTTSEINADITVAMECRVSFPTLEKPLVSKPSIFIRYAVAVTQVQMTDIVNKVLNGSDVIVSQRVAYTVRCIPNESRPNPTFIWYLESVEKQRSLNSSYTFVPVEDDHGKALYCKAFNTQSEKDAVSSIISRLYVKVPPTVQITISKENANEFDEVQITCNATGRPENVRFESIQHVYGEVPISIPLSSVSNTVHIPAVRLQDIGTYICSASNGVPDGDGNYFQSARKNLTISGLPKIFASDLNRYASLKERVKVRVEFFTYTPYHTSKIIRHDGKVTVGGRFEISVSQTPILTEFYGKLVKINGFQINFSIDGINIEDFSQYTVFVTNEIGTVSQEFRLLPKEIPASPKNFSFVSFKQYSPIFRWIGGFNGGAPQRFIIEISEAGKTDWTEVIAIEEIPNTNTDNHIYVEESSIEGFSSGVYKARIRSVNEIGESKSNWNDYIEFEIKPDGMSEITSPTAAIVGGCLGAVIVILVVFLFLTGRKVYPGSCKKRKSNTSPPEIPANSTAGERSLYNTLEEATEIRTYETLGKPDPETYENTKVSSL